MKSKNINLGDLIFILLYKFKGEIRGNTTLQKLVDIIRLDSELKVDVNYFPYDYGDFSQQITDVVQVFIDNTWVDKREVNFRDNKRLSVYRLTNTGSKIAKTLYDNLLSSELEYLKIVDKFKDKTQNEILSYSYFWFPQTSKYSKIRKKVFERRKIINLLNGELEKEYNTIVSSEKTIKDVIRESWSC